MRPISANVNTDACRMIVGGKDLTVDPVDQKLLKTLNKKDKKELFRTLTLYVDATAASSEISKGTHSISYSVFFQFF